MLNNNSGAAINILKKEQYKDPNQFFKNQIVWLNSKEAADYLRISVANLRVKVSRGEILVNGKLGRSLRFRREELDKLLESSLNKGALQ